MPDAPTESNLGEGELPDEKHQLLPVQPAQPPAAQPLPGSWFDPDDTSITNWNIQTRD